MPARRKFLTAAAATTTSAAARALGADRTFSADRPVRYPDPDIVVLDPRFARYKLGNTPLQRLHTGMLWAEGPAGTRSAATSSGATSPTTCSCAASRRTATSA
jgi:hypothetical protein